MLRALTLLVALTLADPEVAYRPPVDAAVSDPFRPPASRYGRGNRGVEYDTGPGDAVLAAAAGTVSFAGPVGGQRYVTVLHPDGVRTTYGPLARIAADIARGTRVALGDRLGTAGELLLWTARIGTAYVDPTVLVAASGTVRVHLVADRRRPRPLSPLGPR